MFSGTEHFRGVSTQDSSGSCGGSDPTGTFFTTFTFTAKFDPSGNEIHGRCNHPIVDGDGGFEGVTGVVNFTDDVTTVPVSATYVGVVRLQKERPQTSEAGVAVGGRGVVDVVALGDAAPHGEPAV